MSNYNEGARGRARYWMERAQRAEAECERLRDALNDHHQWARTHGHEMGLGYLNSWLDIKTREALATPPPEGETTIERVARHMRENTEPLDEDSAKVLYENRWELYDTDDAPHTPEQTSYCPRCTQEMDHYSVTHCPSCDISVGGPPSSEQAHGDALVDEIAPPIPPFNSEAEEEEYHCESAVRHYSERVREKLRRHLTASGVPCVQEEAKTTWEHIKGAMNAGHIPSENMMEDMDKALAYAPEDGYKMVPVEPTKAMIEAADAADDEYTERQFGPGVQRMQLSGYDHWMAMIAAAPTDGRD